MVERSMFLIFCPDGYPDSAIANIFVKYSNSLNKQLVICAPDREVNGVESLLTRTVPIFSSKTISEAISQFDTSIVALYVKKKKRRIVREFLLGCRNIRIPYLIWSENSINLQFPATIVVPIRFLPEEKEKGPVMLELQKCWRSDLRLISPNDKGTRADKNITQMGKLFSASGISWTTIRSKRSSFKINMNSVKYCSPQGNQILFICSSRDYGLDDLVFGPVELHVILKSSVPVLLINPRDDLYMFCGT